MNMNHGKLISETVTINITALCEPYCNPTDNLPSYCPDLCFFNCPSFCITPFIPPPRVTATAVHRSQNHLQALVISLCLVGLACLLYCLFTLYKHCKSIRRPFQEQQRQEEEETRDEELGPVLDHPIWHIRTVGLRPSVVGSIAVFKYKRGEGLVEGTVCAVCLSEFEEDETLRLLPKCNHAFHVPCIDTWLGSHTSCPMCRAPIVSNPDGTLSPILGQSFELSVVVEGNREPISEGSEELAQERDDGDFGSKGVESSGHGRRISGSAEKCTVQSMRRSVSMESLAPSRLDSGIAKGERGEMSKPNTAIIRKRADLRRGLMKSVGASSFRKSSLKGPVLMKRSFSCSGKALFSSPN